MREESDTAKTLPMEKLERIFHARYRLISEIDRGGMGVVWRADDLKLNRTVALKFLPEMVVHDPETMADLAAETRRCLELTHPNIVRVYDFVEEHTQAAISMELVDGPSLADRKLQQPSRCFTPDTLRPWIAQLCSALDYAHQEAGIVHRDLKPLNLLVNSKGDLKVVDFGIARSLRSAHTLRSGSGRSSGVSLAYAGPQQLLGSPAAVTDDVYTLGATLYEMLTSKPPFYEGDLFTQVRDVVPPKMSVRRKELGITGRGTIPAAWEETIAACLAKDPADRPPSAGAVAARLGISLPGTSPGPSRPRPLVWISTLAGVAAAATLALLALNFFSSPSAVEPGTGAPPAPGAAARPRSVTTAARGTPAREFLVSVEPADSGARLWLGPRSELIVPADGKIAIGDLPDGEHELIVQAAGYQPHTRRVNIQDGRGSADVKLTAVYGTAEIAARAGTVVSAIDTRGRRRALGTVPTGDVLRVEKTLTVGTYSFLLTHPDCGDIQQNHVPLAVGRVARITLPQMPLPGELRVFSLPAGAEVLVNGTKAGVTPTTLPAQPSEKPLAIEVALAGHRRFKQTVTLRPKETASVDAGTLVPESGGIEFRIGGSPLRLPGAIVRVDGREESLNQGRIDNLETGVRAIEISHPNYETLKLKVTVRDGQTVPAPLKLNPKPGVLTLAVTGPATYKLTANGAAVAVKDHQASLPAEQPLVLEISANGFKAARREISLAAGQPHRLALTLAKTIVATPGQPWTVPDLGMTFMPVAPGSFLMGSDNGEENERPITKVTVRQPYWMGRTEVTQKEWHTLMGDSNRSLFQGDNLPVQNVSWIEAVEYCRRLTERERKADRLPADYVYSLPTEVQWEYACRAGTTDDFSGNITEMAWYEANSNDTPHPVASKKANAWGLHDMHGNVWEWCADVYTKTVSDTVKLTKKSGATAANRVRRGGSWVVKDQFLRSSVRGISAPDDRNFNIGLRVALVPAD